MESPNALPGPDRRGSEGKLLKVQLKHRDGALEWWGHGALRKCLTAVEVDAMKVRLELFNVETSTCYACLPHFECEGLE